MHAGEPDGWLGIAELRRDRGEPLIEHPGPVMSGVRLSDFLPPVGHDQRHQGACPGYRREHELQDPHGVVQRGWPVAPEPSRAQQHPRQPGQADQANDRHRETHRQGGADAP